MDSVEDSTDIDMSIEEFLTNRNIPEDIISYFIQEKIDCSTILMMSEDDLKNLIPKYGDRLAIKNFAIKKTTSKKQSLIEKLRNKMKSKNKSNTIEPKLKNNTISKTTRIIEIGWHHMDKKENRYRQVKKIHGGGTRRVSMNKNSKCNEILEVGEKLFFPNGVSTKGPSSDFEIELLDFKCHKFDMSMTIQEMYDLSALSTLRFYVATIRKFESMSKDESKDNETDYIPATLTREQEASTSKPSKDTDYDEPENNGVLIPINTYPSSSVRRSDRLRRSDNFQNYLENFTEEFIFDVSEEVLEPELVDIYNLPDSPTVHSEPQKSTFEKLIVHRGNIFRELMEAFQQREICFRSIQIEMILPNGKPEQAEDIGGVLRDLISEFFQDFYEICTMGTELKVPALRHDFQNDEWGAIGKIMKESFISQRYFPIKLAPTFIKNCMDQEVEDSEVLENFIKYVSRSDASLLKNALDDFENVDLEEIREFCANYDGKWIPTSSNFGKMIIQIAREEIIQKPAFVKECIKPHLIALKDQFDLKILYSKYEITDNNIIALFNIDDNISTEKKKIFNYLKRYIKESDEKAKSAFLRFCTGSDLPIQRIEIDFNDSEGFGRIPIAHTCSGLLQMPTSYENFMNFRKEFNNLLSSDIWIMDIV